MSAALEKPLASPSFNIIRKIPDVNIALLVCPVFLLDLVSVPLAICRWTSPGYYGNQSSPSQQEQVMGALHGLLEN